MHGRLPTWCGFVLLIAAAATCGGCPGFVGSGGGSLDDDTKGLRRFKSADELLTFFRQQAGARYQVQWRNGGAWALGGALPTTAEDESAGADGDTSYSSTNLQEAGVDESDVFKSDGQYFYIARGQVVHVVDATPAAELAEVGRITLAQPVDSMYLNGSSLIILAQGYADTGPLGAEMEMWPPYYGGGNVNIYQVDLTNRASPIIAHQTELEGNLVSSRLIGTRLFVVLTIVPDLPDNATSLSIAQMSLDQILPRATVGGDQQAMLVWTDYYRPGPADGYYTTAVVTLDTANVEQIVGSVGIMADAGTIYASQNALYVSDDDWDAQNDYRQLTKIHKFAFDEQTGTRYVGTGSVPGRLLNQFSLGEHNGYLRLATHIDNWGLFVGSDVVDVAGVTTATDTAPATDSAGSNAASKVSTAQDQTTVNQPYNAVYVLGDAADELPIVGRVENIAPGETLYAARFTGDRGFLVTFEQIDPLFVLDLADPTQPAVAGELEIPGYSEYLHPYGDDLLIGVGRSTTPTQWGGTVPDALQLSLFDVSDLANPALVQQVEVGGYGSYSEVSNTHKALVFMADRGLLAIPADLTNDDATYDDYDWTIAFTGVLCYQVSAQGFAPLGRVAAVIDEQGGDGWEWYRWWSWQRPAVIGDTVYAVTSDGVRAAPLSDFTATTTLLLPADEQ